MARLVVTNRSVRITLCVGLFKVYNGPLELPNHFFTHSQNCKCGIRSSAVCVCLPTQLAVPPHRANPQLTCPTRLLLEDLSIYSTLATLSELFDILYLSYRFLVGGQFILGRIHRQASPYAFVSADTC